MGKPRGIVLELNANVEIVFERRPGF